MAGERNGKRGIARASVNLGAAAWASRLLKEEAFNPCTATYSVFPPLVWGQEVGGQLDRSKWPCREQGTAGMAPHQPGEEGFWLCRCYRLQLSRANAPRRERLTPVRDRRFSLSLQGTNGSRQSRSKQIRREQSDIWTRKSILSFLQSSRI